MTVAPATPDPAHTFAAATVEKWITETGLDRTTAARIRDAIRIYSACLAHTINEKRRAAS